MFLSIYISLISSTAGYQPLPTFSTWFLEGRNLVLKRYALAMHVGECTYIYIYIYSFIYGRVFNAESERRLQRYSQRFVIAFREMAIK